MSKTPDDMSASERKDIEGIVLPDGTPLSESLQSGRERDRQTEDQQYVPVIIKRTDETRRHPDDALHYSIEEGLEQIKRPALALWLSAIAAGLIVGFSAMAVAVVLTATADMQIPDLLRRILAAFVYPLGFVVCVLSGAQLFTEHTATALYPVLDRKATCGQLIRLWSLVILGNLVGAVGCGLLHCGASEVVDARQGFLELGHHLVNFSSGGLLISAVMAGWLMALGAWLAVSSPRTIAQITVIYIVTFLIGIGGLHHSIAGSVELFTAMFLGSDFAPSEALRFVLLALLGNLIGGSCFVALLNYAHIRHASE
jgi:formate/nitrite transporter FocA (FNT family)